MENATILFQFNRHDMHINIEKLAKNKIKSIKLIMTIINHKSFPKTEAKSNGMRRN